MTGLVSIAGNRGPRYAVAVPWTWSKCISSRSELSIDIEVYMRRD